MFRSIPNRLKHALPLLALFSFACASPSQGPRPLGANVVLQLNQAHPLPPGEIYLKPIPGGLQGKAADEEILRLLVDGEEVRMVTRTLAAELARMARPVPSDQIHPGELVTPRTARFARVATFFEPSRATGQCNNFSMGLLDERQNGQLLLYVDRAAAIVGTHYSAPYIFDYDLRFPRRGLYLIGLRPAGPVVTPYIVGDTERLMAHIRPSACTTPVVVTSTRGQLELNLPRKVPPE